MKISKFTEKVRGSQKYRDPDTKWTIARDSGKANSHGGSYWKLFNSKGKRVATLTKEGKVLRK
ncbi:hypothetical protein CHI12_16755 [Terribacillus saccharophilus]|uniref:Novel toxin 21 domain-containing protein n=1 Tax=Terribacillus saccharophilus TaxID=361277 RepID=A0A268H952_9BACI|nr:hypothetical protein CHI12_16755 [Terribacillus saccharophilus]